MARKDLLSEAIADAKAVKETALANAKLALEEAFTPKLQSMISAKLAEEADEEEMEEDLDSTDLGAGDNAEPADAVSDSSDIENDDELTEEEDEMAEEEEPAEESYHEEEDMDEEEMHSEEEGEEMEDENEEDTDDELDLESVIAELEAEMEEPADESYHEEEVEETYESEEEDMDEEEEIDLDEVIRTLKEMEDDSDVSEEEDMDEEESEELEEAYKTIESLQKTINEVNLLNAKLLYTNKLFRTFDLNEGQKVKVLENFDRTSSVREVKLVFSTLAENLNVSKKKRTVVKEGYASKATKSSAPKKIISEGNDMAARWKKLAGLK